MISLICVIKSSEFVLLSILKQYRPTRTYVRVSWLKEKVKRRRKRNSVLSVMVEAWQLAVWCIIVTIVLISLIFFSTFYLKVMNYVMSRFCQRMTETGNGYCSPRMSLIVSGGILLIFFCMSESEILYVILIDLFLIFCRSGILIWILKRSFNVKTQIK